MAASGAGLTVQIHVHHHPPILLEAAAAAAAARSSAPRALGARAAAALCAQVIGEGAVGGML